MVRVAVSVVQVDPPPRSVSFPFGFPLSGRSWEEGTSEDSEGGGTEGSGGGGGG